MPLHIILYIFRIFSRASFLFISSIELLARSFDVCTRARAHSLLNGKLGEQKKSHLVTDANLPPLCPLYIYSMYALHLPCSRIFPQICFLSPCLPVTPFLASVEVYAEWCWTRRDQRIHHLLLRKHDDTDQKTKMQCSLYALGIQRANIPAHCDTEEKTKHEKKCEFIIAIR